MKYALFGALLIFNSLGFEMVNFPLPVPESNPVTCSRVMDGKTRFTFVTPAGWVTRSDAAKRAVSIQKGTEAVITIQLSTNTMPANFAELRLHVQQRFESPVVIEEFEAPSGGQPGVGAEVRHIVNKTVPLLTRWCLYRAPDCTLEVSFTRRVDDNAPDLHSAWTSFINSLRPGPRVEATARPALDLP